ncbi:MAG: MaoC family dehydratase N-terminal domain-containing protein [Bauldia litoralis]
MVDRDLIGFEYPSHRATVEAWQLRLFGAAIGANGEGTPVPPTFGYALKSAVPEPLARFRALGIDTSRLLHGDQSFAYHRPLRAGETYSVKTRIADVYERKGGSLTFLVEETRILDRDDAPVVTLRSTFVIRA